MEITNYLEAEKLVANTNKALIDLIIKLMLPLKIINFDLGEHISFPPEPNDYDDVLIFDVINKKGNVYLNAYGEQDKPFKIQLTDERLENWHLVHIIKMIEKKR